MDGEGRCVITDHGAFVLFNLYIPAITSEDPLVAEERFSYKMRFLEAGHTPSSLSLLPAPLPFPKEAECLALVEVRPYLYLPVARVPRTPTPWRKRNL